MAARIGDGYVNTSPDADLVRLYPEAGPRAVADQRDSRQAEPSRCVSPPTRTLAATAGPAPPCRWSGTPDASPLRTGVRGRQRGPKRGAGCSKEITAGLSTHAYIKERILYPEVRSKFPDLTSQVLEAVEEHHIVKWTLHEFDGITPDDEAYGAKLAVLMENLRRHVKEEERGLFPGLRKSLSRAELSELGDRLNDARKLAPTRPHPQAPSGNSVVGLVVGAMDRAHDMGSALVERLTGR